MQREPYCVIVLKMSWKEMRYLRQRDNFIYSKPACFIIQPACRRVTFLAIRDIVRCSAVENTFALEFALEQLYYLSVLQKDFDSNPKPHPVMWWVIRMSRDSSLTSLDHFGEDGVWWHFSGTRDQTCNISNTCKYR